jgi:hypothetical protein
MKRIKKNGNGIKKHESMSDFFSRLVWAAFVIIFSLSTYNIFTYNLCNFCFHFLFMGRWNNNLVKLLFLCFVHATGIDHYLRGRELQKLILLAKFYEKIATHFLHSARPYTIIICDFSLA